MGQRVPGSGRTKGTPNKRTVEVIERLTALDCDPIAAMAKAVSMDALTLAIEGGYIDAADAKKDPIGCRVRACDLYPPELRLKMASELAQYVAPKRKAVEHSGEITAIVPLMPIPGMPPSDVGNH